MLICHLVSDSPCFRVVGVIGVEAAVKHREAAPTGEDEPSDNTPTVSVR